jgi:hypothetical protein
MCHDDVTGQSYLGGDRSFGGKKALTLSVMNETKGFVAFLTKRRTPEAAPRILHADGGRDATG